MELSPFWEAASLSTTNNFPTFHGTQIYSNMLTRALYWPLSWARWIQTIQPHHTSLTSIVLHYVCVFSVVFSFCISYQKFYMHDFSLHADYVPCPSHFPLVGHSNYFRRRVQVMKLLITWFSPVSCYVIPLKFIYSSQPNLCYAESDWLLNCCWSSPAQCFESHGTHDHILLSDGSGSRAMFTACVAFKIKERLL
jgi:hypothetical protein